MSDEERTIFCGNLSDKVTEEILFELFLQAGPVDHVRIPRDKDRQKSFGFVTFSHACSVDYALLIFEGTKLFHRPMAINRRGQTNNSPQNQRQMNFVYPQSPMNPSIFVNSINSPKMGQQSPNLFSPEPLLNRINNPFSNVHPDILRHLGSQIVNPFMMNIGDQQLNFQNKINQKDDRNNKGNKPYSRDNRNDQQQRSHNNNYNNHHSNKNNKDRGGHGNNQGQKRHSNNNYKR